MPLGCVRGQADRRLTGFLDYVCALRVVMGKRSGETGDLATAENAKKRPKTEACEVLHKGRHMHNLGQLTTQCQFLFMIDRFLQNETQTSGDLHDRINEERRRFVTCDQNMTALLNHVADQSGMVAIFMVGGENNGGKEIFAPR